MNTLQVGISYGAMSEPISTQLTKQGLQFDVKKVTRFEELLDHFHHLRFSDLLTDSMCDTILKKLHKQIMQHVGKKNNRPIIQSHKA